jgi:3-oxoacyl-[acyl-carrier-protein] synthase-1
MERMRKYGVMRCQPLGIVASIAGTVNFNLVAHFHILGASTGFSSACASSGHAMGFAYDDISLGRQERMFVIGAEDGNYDSIMPFAGMRALSIQSDPDLASRPFDIKRDGFVGTGGATVIVLESEDEIARRGVTPYCEFLGWGQASDGHSVAMSHPEGRGLKQALKSTLSNTKLDPGEVDYINAHATSTPIGDISEARAIDAIFSKQGARPAVSSTKALTGHGLSLASAMEAGFCALAIKEGFTPGSANIREIDPECAGLNIIQETLPVGPKTVISPSSGFGGANVCLAFRRCD